jgi:hypothetical protein
VLQVLHYGKLMDYLSKRNYFLIMLREELEALSTKNHDPDELQILEVQDPLSSQFDDDSFSDFVVYVRNQTFRLHKVILSQSPFLKQHLNQDSVVLDCDPVGIKLCLLDLYHTSRSNIRNENIFQVLDAACFLELHELSYFCYDFILTKLTKLETIQLFCSQIHQGNNNITEKYATRLNQALLGTLLYCCSVCSSEVVEEMSEIDSVCPDTPLCLFLANLPLIWIEKVMKSDMLCIPCEFDRYVLMKQILWLRQSRPVEAVTVELPAQKKDNVVTGVAKKVYSLFDGLIPRAKKRKLEESDEETVSSPVCAKRAIKPLPNRPTLPQTISNIYESGIIYTYMTFPQLGIVKKDEIVPLHLALESYWLQAELGTNEHGKELPPLRFAYCFSSVSKYFENQENTVMTSDPVICAGVQYRLLLCKDKEKNEIKALLQKSKGKGPSVAYSIYAFDNRALLEKHQVIQLVQPITTVTNGEGFANPLLQNPFKTEQDRIWLTCSVTFE